MGATVAVAGASGYAGGELLRLLAVHPDLEIGPVTAHGSAGTSVTALHPQLTGHPGLRDRVFVPADPGRFADADLLFTALPHGESARLAAELPAQLKIIVLAASGTSGAGRSLRPELLATEVMGSMSAYQVAGTHRHIPEIEQTLSSERTVAPASPPVTLSFTPTLAPMPRGILATCTARLASGGAGSALRDALAAAYDGEPFVHLLAEGRWPSTGPTAGSNAADLQVAADTHAGRAIAVCALDNLGKGAASQAIQIANLMLGLPETAGLTAYGVSP